MNFDDYAKNWDTDKRIKRAQVIANEIGKTINPNKDYTAMEFGCGTGLISFNLQDRFKSITLIDSSKGMIDILKSKINTYKVDNMIPFQVDISNENILDMKFDVTYSSMVLHHIYDTATISKKFFEMLKVGGYLCIVDLDEENGNFHKNHPEFDGHNGFNQEALKEILAQTGFKDIKSNTFFYDEKVIEGQKVPYSLFLMTGRK